MRDQQVATFETWKGFKRGLISSNKPNIQAQSPSILRMFRRYFPTIAYKASRAAQTNRGMVYPNN